MANQSATGSAATGSSTMAGETGMAAMGAGDASSTTVISSGSAIVAANTGRAAAKRLGSTSGTSAPASMGMSRAGSTESDWNRFLPTGSGGAAGAIASGAWYPALAGLAGLAAKRLARS